MLNYHLNHRIKSAELTCPQFVTKEFIDVCIDKIRVRIAVTCRKGKSATLLALHGFGSTKEDYCDLMRHPAFQDMNIISYDAPGFGESECSEPSALSISFLSQVAQYIIDFYDASPLHLIGHSMGGLTALMAARETPQQLLSFSNIEGNLAPEDCFLSRQIITDPNPDPREFLEAFAERVWRQPGYANQLYSAGLRYKVRPEAVAPILRSMVELSDNTELLKYFVQLPCPKLFVYGEENKSLSYLLKLAHSNVQLSEIPYAAHFPMYSNPPALWACLSEFIAQ